MPLPSTSASRAVAEARAPRAEPVRRVHAPSGLLPPQQPVERGGGAGRAQRLRSYMRAHAQCTGKCSARAHAAEAQLRRVCGPTDRWTDCRCTTVVVLLVLRVWVTWQDVPPAPHHALTTPKGGFRVARDGVTLFHLVGAWVLCWRCCVWRWFEAAGEQAEAERFGRPRAPAVAALLCLASLLRSSSSRRSLPASNNHESVGLHPTVG